MDMKRRLGAEVFGTFWLVLGGCGSAVLAGEFIGVLGVALAFGLTVVTMAYAVGGISGGHFNPAVTLGLVVAGRFDKKDAPAYMGAQVVGAIAAAVVIAIIASGKTGFEFGDGPLNAPGFASNGFGDRSPGGYSFVAVVEFGPKVRARAVSAGGESGDPASPHFNDQAQLYADGNLRDVYFYPEDVAAHARRTYRPGQ